MVLFSFSLSAFASYDIYEYQDINSIAESFLTSFFSYCGLTARLYDYDELWYEGEDFDKAALRNVVVRFANYLEQKNPALINNILFFATDNGVTSSINNSSYFWMGELKDNPSLFSDLLSSLVNFLYPYWVKLPSDSSIQNYYGLVPFSMNVTPDGEQYTGCYTWVEFDGFFTLDEWQTDFVSVVKSYLYNDSFLNYSSSYFFFWTYKSFGGTSPYEFLDGDFTRCTFLNDIREYEYLNGGSVEVPGDSSDSSDTSSDNSSGDSSDTSSDDSEIIVDNANAFYSSFYPSLFYSCLSSYDVNIFSIDYNTTSLYYGPPTFTDIEYVLNRAFSIVFQGMISGEYDDIYPTALTDFKNIAHSEYDYFIDSDIQFYQIDFNSSLSYNRFYYGFYEMFFSTFDDVDDELSRSEFGNCEFFSFDGMTLCFSYDASENIGQGSWLDCGFYDKFYNFTQTYKGPLLIPFHKDTSLYFDDYTWHHITYDWSTTFKIFSGYSEIEFLENEKMWEYDKNALYENWSDLIKIEVIIVPVPDGLESSFNFDFLTSYINSFFLWSETFLGFLRSCISLFPSSFMGIIVGGFILLIVTVFLLYK